MEYLSNRERRVTNCGCLLGDRSLPSNLIGANGFAVGGRGLGWRLRHPGGTQNPLQLGHRLAIVRHVLQNVKTQDDIE